MPDLWVLNASPLIVLGKAGLLGILPQLAGEVAIPHGVIQELLAGPPGDPARDFAATPLNCTVVQPTSIHPLVAAWDLDRGESEVLSLALQRPNWEAVIDDRAARNCAQALGLPYRGTLGVLVLAHAKGIINDPVQTLERIKAAGLRIHEDIAQEFLNLAAGDRTFPDAGQ